MSERFETFRDRPFSLLRAIEAEVLGGETAEVAGENLWVGVACRIGTFRFVSARAELREILTWPGVTHVPRARSWLLGLANVRGQLLPVTDLMAWAGGGETVLSRNSRILVVNHPDIPVGLLVDQVVGFRRFPPANIGEVPPGALEALRPFLLGSYERDDEQWTVLGLRDLVESEGFLQAAS